MRPLGETEINSVAGGPTIIIEPSFKSKDDGSESAPSTVGQEADGVSNDR